MQHFWKLQDDNSSTSCLLQAKPPTYPSRLGMQRPRSERQAPGLSLSYLCRALGCGWQSRAAIPGETSRGLLPAGNGFEADDSRNSRFRILERKSVPLGEKSILLTIWVNHLAERGVKKNLTSCRPAPGRGSSWGRGQSLSTRHAMRSSERKTGTAGGPDPSLVNCLPQHGQMPPCSLNP